MLQMSMENDGEDSVAFGAEEERRAAVPRLLAAVGHIAHRRARSKGPMTAESRN